MQRVSSEEHAPHEPLSWKLGPMPAPGPNEVLVQVHAFGINHVDLEQRQKLYPRPPGAGPVYGLELSGTVVGIGPRATRFKVGDTIMSLVTDGAYAEYAVCREEVSFHSASYLSMEEAAALPESLFTLALNLWKKVDVQKGETVLIHGMAGAIGSLAIPLLKAWGCKVIGTVSSQKKREFCLELGADEVYLRDDAAWTKRNSDVVLDCIGGDVFQKSLVLLNKKGRIVSIDCIRGETVALDLGAMIVKQISIFGSVLRPLSIEEKASVAQIIESRILPLMAAKRIRPPISTLWEKDQLEEAQNALRTASGLGKNVVTLKAGQK